MKKGKVLAGIVGTFIVCVAVVNVFVSISSRNEFSGRFDLKLLASLTDQESNGESNNTARFYKKEGDCTKVFTVDADGYVMILGTRRYVGGVLVTYTETYHEVKIDCLVGTTHYNCTECTCTNFWQQKC
jgi:hypothetical protein